MSPLTVGFAKSLGEYYRSQLSSEEMAVLKQADKMAKDSIYVEDFLQATKPLADAILRYLDGDLTGAENFLKVIQLPQEKMQPNQPQTKNDYMNMNTDIKSMKNNIAWKIYDAYELRGDWENAVRIFKKYLK